MDYSGGLATPQEHEHVLWLDVFQGRPDVRFAVMGPDGKTVKLAAPELTTVEVSYSVCTSSARGQMQCCSHH